MTLPEWVIVDTETTGLQAPIYALEIAAQRMRGLRPVDTPFRVFLNHNVRVPERAYEVHGYSRSFLARNGRDPIKAHKGFAAYAGLHPVCAYNLPYDYDKVLAPEWARLGVRPLSRGFCLLKLTKQLLSPSPAGNHKLQVLRSHFGLPERDAHSALGDVQTVVDLLQAVIAPQLEKRGGTDEQLSLLMPGKPESQLNHGSGHGVTPQLEDRGRTPGNSLEKKILDFTRDMLLRDDEALMVKAHRQLHNLGLSAGSLRTKLEAAAARITVRGRDGTEKPARWPKAKLDMIIAGATRSDAREIQDKADDLASREGVRANAYHIAAYMAATALDMPGADVDTLAQSAEKKYPSGTALEDKRRKAKSAGKAMQKAMVAFMKEAEAHADADELADAQEELDGAMAALQKVVNVATGDE